MKNSTMTLTDRLGICYGTVLFLLMLPVTIFVSALPAIIIKNAISNAVLALALNLSVMTISGLMTLLFSMVSGLALSYGLSWLGRKLHIQQAFEVAKSTSNPIEASKKVNIGAFIGLGLAAMIFVAKGSVPIHSVTTRVEHLFPAPLTLSLGNMASFDVSHTYAATTGFLSVGFLFLIIGIALGSLVSAAVEAVAHRAN